MGTDLAEQQTKVGSSRCDDRAASSGATKGKSINGGSGSAR
jgi:hypothetical protein